MPRKPIDLINQRFGKLVAIEWQPAPTGGSWLCACECGNTKLATSNHLKDGRIRSCGCARERHGGKGTRAYSIWRGVISRCTDPHHKNWPDYGGRGITVCDRWKSFSNFVSDIGTPPVGFTLERIDNSRGYEPGNCRWASRTDQARNTRRNRIIVYNGESKSLAEWAETFGINYFTLYTRIAKLGWEPERAFVR